MDSESAQDFSAKKRTNAITALACGFAAFVLAMIETVTSAFDGLPFPMSLPILGLIAFAIGQRELSVRAQFSAQADRYRASSRELESKNRWFSITEHHAKVGHWRLDLKTNVVFWSDATFAIHGLEPGNPPSLNDAVNFYHPDDRDVVVDQIEQARETGNPYTFRARIIAANGELRHVDAGASVECAPDGSPAALFGVINDRTAEEAMQADLRAARDEANDLANAKGQFLARMSHEIRTPMNGLLGFAELLELSDLDPEQRRHTEIILESGRALQVLLGDILDLTKIEAGKIELQIAKVDLSQLMGRVEDMAKPLAQNKGIKLACHIAHDVPRYAHTDALRLRQILSNLMSNAVRFTDSGIVSLAVQNKDGILHFSVTDTGAGIAPEMRSRIFDPFTQDQSNPTNLESGTGLGLAISRHLAELMGGDITVRSEFGQGSIFTLTLPERPAGFAQADAQLRDDGTRVDALPVGILDAHDAHTARTDNAEPLPVPNRPLNPDARVLLAEDFEINRELIIDMAKRIGVTIECAEDGAEAVAMVHHARASGQPFELLFMDLQMPKLDGLEATKRIRDAGISQEELPIVALTANAFPDDIENCLAAGMQEHLAKPLSMQRLTEAVTRWAPQTHASHRPTLQ